MVAATADQRAPGGQPTRADLLRRPGLGEGQGPALGSTSGGSLPASDPLPHRVIPERPGFEIRFVEGIPYWFPSPESKLQCLSPEAYLQPFNSHR